jgi:hypothetical protein
VFLCGFLEEIQLALHLYNKTDFFGLFSREINGFLLINPKQYGTFVAWPVESS